MDGLIDPFDAPTATIPTQAAPQQAGALVDPFDAPAPNMPNPQRQYVDDPDRAAGVGTVAIGSLAEDTPSRIQYFAKEMGVDPSRMQAVGGAIYYQGDDGKFYDVEAGVLNKFAKGAGPAIPAVGGMVGTIAGMGLGPPGMAGGGITGAMAGQTAREYAAQALMGQKPSAGRVVREGAFDLGATLVGMLVGKGVAKAAATRAGKELNAAMSAGGKSAMRALEQTLDKVNREYGVNIRLTPAELSNAAKLRGQQQAIDNTPGVSQRMEDYYKDRATESGKAFDGLLNKEFAPAGSIDEFGEQLGKSAGEAIDGLAKKRAAGGGRLYKKAFAQAEEIGGVNIEPVVRYLDDVSAGFPPARDGLKEVREMLAVVEPGVDGRGGKLVPFDNLEHIQNTAKEHLDDLISTAKQSGKFKLANKYRDVQKNLLRQLDEQVPLYGRARKVWGDLSAPITKAEGGILPALAGKTEKDFEYMGKRFLTSASPAEIGRARTAILKTEGGDASWNATLRGALEQHWEQAGRIPKSQISRPGLQSARPSTFWASMIGQPEQAKRLQAAMSPRQWKAFGNLMSVFEATGRATNYNSTTVLQSAGRDMLKGGGVTSEAIKTVTNPNPLSWALRAEKGVQNIVDDMNVNNLVDVITNSGSVDELLKISTRKAGRDKAAVFALKALNLARGELSAYGVGPFAP